jgi:uncharacterized membrane protein
MLLFPGIVVATLLLPGASLLDRLRLLDSGICAQMITHTFAPGGELLPLCARNTGIYLAFIVTLITFHAIGKGHAQRFPTRGICILIACGVVACGIDGLNSFAVDLGLAHLYQPQNWLRLATGLATGVALASCTSPLLNRLLWCEFNERRVLSSWYEFALLLPALLLCFYAVATQRPVFLYPVALLSTIGVLIAAGSVNLIGLVALSKRDESFIASRELLPFLSIALTCALVEMLVLAQLKLTVLHAIGL